MDEYSDDQTSETIWLPYALTPSITPSLRRQLLKHFPNPTELASLLRSSKPTLHTNDADFNQHASSVLQQRDTADVKKHLKAALLWKAAHPTHHIIGLSHSAYPPSLLATTDAPPVLYVKGNIDCLSTPCVAIVGARKATHSGLEHAHQIATELAQSGITIISGLALGTDAAAHQGALHGGGETIAISATGPEKIYPRTHIRLAEQIHQNGAIVTEFPLHSSLQPYCFPRRNRIISGMSIGVLVVEAALPSGTLTTAQHALRQGREVMAMPGSVDNPLTRGCHELLKNGAALVENATDVLRCLGPELERHVSRSNSVTPPTANTAIRKKMTNMAPDTITLLDCLGFDPASVDTLMRRSGLNAAQVTGALTHLELSGVIVADGGGHYTRCTKTDTPSASATLE